MKILIIEDEEIASQQLAQFIKKFDESIEILAVLRSIKEGMVWFAQNPAPDLIFSDIEVLDGNIFGLFSSIVINSPIVFTTAYDQFLLKAFQTNGISYILKPYDYQQVSDSFEKYYALKKSLSTTKQVLDPTIIDHLRAIIQPSFKNYKQRFTVKMRNGILILPVEEISHFQADEGIIFAHSKNQQKYPLNGTLAEIEGLIDPAIFFRINRSEIININYLEKLEPYFNDRLSIKLKNCPTLVHTSSGRTSELRKWLA